jgi:hypothetical protein
VKSANAMTPATAATISMCTEDQPKPEVEGDRQAAEKPKGIKRVVSFVRSRSTVEKALALLVFILAFLWIVPELQVRYFAQDVDSANVPGLINGLFLGLYFTWRRVEISQQTLETQQDQQITERFTRAIDPSYLLYACCSCPLCFL